MKRDKDIGISALEKANDNMRHADEAEARFRTLRGSLTNLSTQLDFLNDTSHLAGEHARETSQKQNVISSSDLLRNFRKESNSGSGEELDEHKSTISISVGGALRLNQFSGSQYGSSPSLVSEQAKPIRLKLKTNEPIVHFDQSLSTVDDLALQLQMLESQLKTLDANNSHINDQILRQVSSSIPNLIEVGLVASRSSLKSSWNLERGMERNSATIKIVDPRQSQRKRYVKAYRATFSNSGAMLPPPQVSKPKNRQVAVTKSLGDLHTSSNLTKDKDHPVRIPTAQQNLKQRKHSSLPNLRGGSIFDRINEDSTWSGRYGNGDNLGEDEYGEAVRDGEDWFREYQQSRRPIVRIESYYLIKPVL